MGFIDDLSDMMTDTVTHYAFSSYDGYGKPTYASSGTEYTARVVRKHRLVKDAQGKEVVSTQQAWLQGNPNISPRDKVELSDGTEPPVVAVERFQDEVGQSHTVVFYG